jgi:DNA-binding CsgD family transcriptional regulator
MQPLPAGHFAMFASRAVSSLRQRLESYSFTQREKEIVLLLLQGLSNREIAETCFIAEQTVKDHLKHVFSKVGVHHRGLLISTLLRSPAMEDFAKANGQKANGHNANGERPKGQKNGKRPVKRK